MPPRSSPSSPPSLLSLHQLANISAAQRLYDEAAEHASSAIQLAKQLGGPESLDAASCYHMLALCYFHNNRLVREVWVVWHCRCALGVCLVEVGAEGGEDWHS